MQSALSKFEERFVQARASAMARLGNFEALQRHAGQARDAALDRLSENLEKFQENAEKRGAQVHWAADRESANRIVREIAEHHGVRKIIKSKSMLTEEIKLNPALEQAGFEVVETDLGEYILQLSDDHPSHIVAPVIHKGFDDIARLFAEKHGRPRQETPAAVVQEAREMLRKHFLSADMGITGANFLVAETGSVVLVSNEGNARFCSHYPRVHVAVAGIEKVVMDWVDMELLLKLLPPSATGQAISNYVTIATGSKRPEDADGPEHQHIVLIDAGRSRMLGTPYREMLRCIRCGACMNHCPVYQSVGGHAYGWVYPGPMGSILTPLLQGEGADLPHATTACGACAKVCPVDIPLPDLMSRMRAGQVDDGRQSTTSRLVLRLWSLLARHPRLYALWGRVSARMMRALASRKGLARRLPLAGGWLESRDLPVAAGKTFRETYFSRKKGG